MNDEIPVQAPPPRLSRWIRDMLVSVHANYGMIVRTDGECIASVGDPPCPPSRLAPLALTIAEGSSVLLGSGPFERAQLHLRGGSLLLYRLNSQHVLGVYARGSAPVTRQLHLEHAITAIRKELGDAKTDGLVPIGEL